MTPRPETTPAAILPTRTRVFVLVAPLGLAAADLLKLSRAAEYSLAAPPNATRKPRRTQCPENLPAPQNVECAMINARSPGCSLGGISCVTFLQRNSGCAWPQICLWLRRLGLRTRVGQKRKVQSKSGRKSNTKVNGSRHIH